MHVARTYFSTIHTVTLYIGLVIVAQITTMIVLLSLLWPAVLSLVLWVMVLSMFVFMNKHDHRILLALMVVHIPIFNIVILIAFFRDELADLFYYRDVYCWKLYFLSMFKEIYVLDIPVNKTVVHDGFQWHLGFDADGQKIVNEFLSKKFVWWDSKTRMAFSDTKSKDLALLLLKYPNINGGIVKGLRAHIQNTADYLLTS